MADPPVHLGIERLCRGNEHPTREALFGVFECKTAFPAASPATHQDDSQESLLAVQ